MGACIYIRVDAKCDACCFTQANCRSTDLFELWFRFDIELADILLQSELDFAYRLGNA